MNLPEGWEAIPTKNLRLLELYAARYEWLRRGMFYTTDEEFPFGDELDEMCDLGVAGAYGERVKL